MAKAHAKFKYCTVQELCKDAESTNVSEEATSKLAKEKEKTILDMSAVREQEDWSNLADKMVGA